VKKKELQEILEAADKIVDQLEESISENTVLQERLDAAYKEIAKLGQDDEGNNTKALEIAAQCWCDDDTRSITMDTRLAKAFAERLESMLDDMDTAWGLIANAYGGDWDKAGNDWRQAAGRFRDRYISR